MGFYKEVETIGIAHEMDLFTIVYVFNPEESENMAKVGADVIIAHMGTTIGGTIGAETASRLKTQQRGCRRFVMLRNHIILMLFACAHGGPISKARSLGRGCIYQ